jgi:hypothetical protein
MATFAEVADAQKPYIVTGAPLGSMTTERWDTLAKQLQEVGRIVPAAPEAAECLRDALAGA